MYQFEGWWNSCVTNEARNAIQGPLAWFPIHGRSCGIYRCREHTGCSRIPSKPILRASSITFNYLECFCMRYSQIKGRLILLARFFFTLGYGVWCFLLLLYVSYATIPHVTYKEKWFWGECVRLKMSQDLKMNVLYGWVKSYFVSLNNKVAKWLWMTYQTI